MNPTTLSKFVKAMRKQYNLTQVELSEKSGVGLRFVQTKYWVCSIMK